MADARFVKAVYYIRHAPAVESSNDAKLQLYALFKQATVGDVQGTQPWAVQLEARAKWDAWNEKKGMSAEEAKKLYGEELDRLAPGWESSELLAKIPSGWKVTDK